MEYCGITCNFLFRKEPDISWIYSAWRTRKSTCLPADWVAKNMEGFVLSMLVSIADILLEYFLAFVNIQCQFTFLHKMNLRVTKSCHHFTFSFVGMTFLSIDWSDQMVHPLVKLMMHQVWCCTCCSLLSGHFVRRLWNL